MPIEAFALPHLRENKKIVRYSEVLNIDGSIKIQQELVDQGTEIDWWPRSQLISRYTKDKQQRFYQENTPFNRTLLESERKCITFLYNFLLDFETQDEVVKACMIKWALNIGHNIELNQWKQIWKINITKSTVFKENICKTFYRWYDSHNSGQNKHSILKYMLKM